MTPSEASGSLLQQILVKRGYRTPAQQAAFLDPNYVAAKHDLVLLPDMLKATARLRQAIDRGEQITIYGDYDVDGVTATALLLDALPRFGAKVNSYTPDRFREGYGLNAVAIEHLHDAGTQLIITVDNGIVSVPEVARANELGVDVIVTDHHNPRAELPAAVAVVDPKRLQFDHPDWYDKHYLLKPAVAERLKAAGTADTVGAGDFVVSEAEAVASDYFDPTYAGVPVYPFLDLCGCGVAFKLVQQLQRELPDKLPDGQEKWLLDLVALATVADIVSLVDENRAYVRWGIEVIKRTRRPGIKALAAAAGYKIAEVNATAIGFTLAPRLNAAGRLAHGQLAVDLLSTDDSQRALELANQLNDLNNQRRGLQQEIYEAAIQQVDLEQPVAIVSGAGWHEGVIGIAASKVEEKFCRPTFVFSDGGEFLKASGRSFGDFSIADAITATRDLLEKGGGHRAAGGVTVRREHFAAWCAAVQDYYRSLNLPDQTSLFYAQPDLTITSLDGVDVETVQELGKLEPCGAGNAKPVFLLKGFTVTARRTMGDSGQHVRYTLTDLSGRSIQVVAFDAADRFTVLPGATVDALAQLVVSRFHGLNVEGYLVNLTVTSPEKN